MGYLNETWLEGAPLRDRSHSPVKVSLERLSLNDWDKDNHIEAGLNIVREDGDYQHLLFTMNDLKRLLPDLLAPLADADLLRCFEAALALRRQTPAERDAAHETALLNSLVLK